MADNRDLDTDELDRLLRETMAVEPSPEFLARARERIGRQPVASRWGSGWLVVTAGAVVAFVAAVVVLPSFVANRTALPSPPAAAPPPIAAVLPVPDMPPPPVERRTIRPRRLQSAPAAAASSSAEPLVIIDPRQRAAVNALVALLSRRKADEGAIPLKTDLPDGVAPSITVDSLVVSPIAVGGVLQYDIERK